MADKTRVRIFVDFWNFQIQWNELHERLGAKERVPIPWKELAQVLCAEISKGQPTKFTGLSVYASVNPTSPKDRGLNNFLHHTLASFTGYSVIVKERKTKENHPLPRRQLQNTSIELSQLQGPAEGNV